MDGSYPTYCVIAFKSKLRMTGDLVEQLLDQGNINRIILLDNGMKREPYPWAGERLVDVLVRPGVNLHRMWNQGIAFAQASARDDLNYNGPVNVAVLNNDIVIKSERFVDKMAETLRFDPYVGLVTATIEDVQQEAAGYRFANPDDGWMRADAIMLRADLPYRFDDRFHWYYGDTDLVAQVENGGYSCAISLGSYFEPVQGGSQTINDIDRELFAQAVGRDTDLFYSKWPQIPQGSRALPRHLLRPR